LRLLLLLAPLTRFAVVSEALSKEYANVRYQQPYQWAMYRNEVRAAPHLHTC
jgi:hypothetical protein